MVTLPQEVTRFCAMMCGELLKIDLHLPEGIGLRINRMFLSFLTTVVILTPPAFSEDFKVLREYEHHGSERVNLPVDEIEWLKKHQLTHGELDNFPSRAIILHRTDVNKYLLSSGFKHYYSFFEYGFTDPIRVYVVRKPGFPAFAVARGLPGAGGVTTELADLGAMGAKWVIHVGTCGLLTSDVPYGQLIISDGTYKDGAGFLLSGPYPAMEISQPDPDLTARIERVVSADKLPHLHAVGFTMPIYYLQPVSVLTDLLGLNLPEKPRFVEMEQGSLFPLAQLIGIRAASIVVGSDRLENHNGHLVQGFWSGDLDSLELIAFKEAVRALTDRAWQR